MLKFIICLLVMLTSQACKQTASKDTDDSKSLSAHIDPVGATVSAGTQQRLFVDTQQNIPAAKINQPIQVVTGHQLVGFAQTLIGIPYCYASIDPLKGFDCSGFITYVFNHFNMVVPRSSIDFTNAGEEVDLQHAEEGDLILFTGTVDSIRIVGHMGIVTENIDTLRFIHSTSGKANGVTISLLNEHYKKRFVKIIRVLPG